jgi:16S rRNA (guanine(966)-N(2))-methyltransferase RsmD
VRVIGGRAKGTRLKVVPDKGVRPITDRVKESLFNIIGADIQESTFLDLFAGTGSVGIEALSRGAAFVHFVDLNPQAVGVIRENLSAARLSAGFEVVRRDALALLKDPPDRPYDYVYIAPPQYQEIWKKALHAVDNRPGWLSDDAWVIVQIHPQEYQPQELTNLAEIDRRAYGSTTLVFFARYEDG